MGVTCPRSVVRLASYGRFLGAKRMTTKRELKRLARKALGRGARVSVGPEYTCEASAREESVGVWRDGDCDREREMLAAALRGIIAWKEGEE